MKGLNDKEVEESRSKYGSNSIPDSEPTTFWKEFKETFNDPGVLCSLWDMRKSMNLLEQS